MSGIKSIIFVITLINLIIFTNQVQKIIEATPY